MCMCVCVRERECMIRDNFYHNIEINVTIACAAVISFNLHVQFIL